ncbi:MAG: thiamine diphosphokinase [Eggerthellaceae bacterium]|nr:thiamine diphosphokinase [Eggerthellaceae bacterium]
MTTCALVGASDFNEARFLEMRDEGAFDYVIAVDGGLASLEAAGVRPDLALGDFDSLGYIPKGLRVARFSPVKDKSDMELALDRARSQHYDEVFVFGALGRRLDHTLANLQLFALFSERGLYVTAVGVDQAVAFITGPDVYEMPAAEEGTVSVFSMSDACEGVFERGMAYGLDDALLTNRTSLGLSNELTGEPVMIGVEKGTLAIFMPA